MNHKEERNRLLKISQEFEKAWREILDEVLGKVEVLSRFDDGPHMQRACEAMESHLERTVACELNTLSAIIAFWFAAEDELAETTDDPDKIRRLRRVVREIKADYIQTNIDLGMLQYWWYVHVDVCENATEAGWDHMQATNIFQKAIKENMRFWGPFVYMQALCANQSDTAFSALIGTHSARTRIFRRYKETIDLLVKELYSVSDGFDPITARAQAKYDIILETLIDNLGEWVFADQEQGAGDQPILSLDMKHWPAWDSIPRLAMQRVDREGQRRGVEFVDSRLAMQVAEDLGLTQESALHSIDPEQALLLAEDLNEALTFQQSAREAIDSLCPRDQEIVSLHIQGMSRRNIAESIGMPERTARTHLERSLDKVKRALTNQPSLRRSKKKF